MGRRDIEVNVLLLGATGYLGGNIANFLSQHGDSVICVVRPYSNHIYLDGNRRIKLISNDPYQIELIFQQECIDWVINGVCTYKPNETLYGDMLESNVIFPLSVLNLSLKHNVKNFITIGTSLPREFNVYSYTKSRFSEFGHYFSQNNNLNFVELKLEMFYGGENEPNDRFVKNSILKLINHERLELTEGFQKRDIIHIEDVVAIIDRIIKSDYVNGYMQLDVGNGENHSIREIVNFLKSRINPSADVCYGAIPSRIGEPDTKADIAWYENINYRIKRKYFDGLEYECNKILNSMVG